MFAMWIRRFSRFVDVADEEMVLILIIAVIGSLMWTAFSFGVHDTIPPLYQLVLIGSWRAAKIILFGWSIMYAAWEFFQAWKWLLNWAEKVRYENEKH
jgi:hypothetical protein